MPEILVFFPATNLVRVSSAAQLLVFRYSYYFRKLWQSTFAWRLSEQDSVSVFFAVAFLSQIPSSHNPCPRGGKPAWVPLDQTHVEWNPTSGLYQFEIDIIKLCETFDVAHCKQTFWVRISSNKQFLKKENEASSGQTDIRHGADQFGMSNIHGTSRTTPPPPPPPLTYSKPKNPYLLKTKHIH